MLCQVAARTAWLQKTSNRSAGPPYSNLKIDKKTLWNVILDSSMLTTYDKKFRLIVALLLFIKEYLYMYFINYAGMKSLTLYTSTLVIAITAFIT